MTWLWCIVTNDVKIEETIVGKDGKIQAAVIRVYTGGKQSKLLRRPVQKLYPLEVNDNHSYSEPSPNCMSNEEITVDDPNPSSQTEGGERNLEEMLQPRKSRRSAAVTSRDQILAQAIQNNYH